MKQQNIKRRPCGVIIGGAALITLFIHVLSKKPSD